MCQHVLLFRGPGFYTDVCCWVSNRYLAISSCSDILLHITSNSLDPFRSHASGNIVNHLISREEEQSVIVFLELVNGGKYILKVDVIVRLSRLVLTKGVEGGVDVQREIDTSILQGVHTCIMVLAVIYRVDADGVDFQFLESCWLKVSQFSTQPVQL